MMESVEKYYGKRNFALYALFMAVPGTNAFYRKIFVTFSVLILSFSTIFQVLKFVTDGFTLKIIVELVPTIVATIGSLSYVFYVTFTNQGQDREQLQFAKLLTAMENDLKEKRTPEETQIKRQFAFSARMFTHVYTGVLVICVCGMPLVGFLPQIFDVLTSANNTRQAELLFNGEIFIDIEKYFYYIYFVECCTVVVVGILVMINENIAIIIGQHTCGMFAVVGYQLENLTEIKEEEISMEITYNDLLTRRLQKCIQSHQSSLEFSIRSAEFYDVPVTIILLACFCTLTMSLVQVTDPELVSMKMVIFTCTQFCQLFIMSHVGQNTIDGSSRIAINAYNAKWDSFPRKLRKLLQMVLLRSAKPCLVLARGIYVLSLENCMSAIQTITSFYMVIRQAR